MLYEIKSRSGQILQVYGDVIDRRLFYFGEKKMIKGLTFCCVASFASLKCILTTIL